MYAQFYVFSPRGDTLLFRDCKSIGVLHAIRVRIHMAT